MISFIFNLIQYAIPFWVGTETLVKSWPRIKDSHSGPLKPVNDSIHVRIGEFYSQMQIVNFLFDSSPFTPFFSRLKTEFFICTSLLFELPKIVNSLHDNLPKMSTVVEAIKGKHCPHVRTKCVHKSHRCRFPAA